MRKDSHGDHSGQLVQPGFHLQRIADREVVHIENVIAVIGDEIFAPHRLPPQFDDLAGDERLGHRQHFDRQWKLAEHADQLRLVDDAHELASSSCQHLLPGQRSAAPLNEVQVLGGLVGAVDVYVQVADRVQGRYLEAVLLEPFGGRAGTRDYALHPVADGGKKVDQDVDCRSGPDAKYRTAVDVLQRSFRHTYFLCGLVHAIRAVRLADSLNQQRYAGTCFVRSRAYRIGGVCATMRVPKRNVPANAGTFTVSEEDLAVLSQSALITF